jgi:hypothetical protein
MVALNLSITVNEGKTIVVLLQLRGLPDLRRRIEHAIKSLLNRT